MPWPNYTLGSGKDFVSMDSAEAGMQTDWGTNSGNSPVTLSCDAFTEAASAEVIWAGWTPDPTAVNTVTVQPAAGAEHGGIWGQGYLFQLTAGFDYVFDMQIPYLRIRGISAESTANSSNSQFQGDALDGSEVSSVMGRYSGAGNRNSMYMCSGVETVRNCLFTMPGGGRAHGIQVPAIGIAENNTVIGEDLGLYQGISQSAGTPTAINNVCVGFGDDFFQSDWTNSSNNASGDTSVVDRNLGTVTGVSLADGVDFVEPSTGNYNAQPGGKLEGVGANLSADFTDDITGYTRPSLPDPWCIGAYEIQGGGAVVQWDGPSIIDQDGVENEFFLFDDNGEGNVASRFSGTGAPFVYAVSAISQPFPDGVQVNGVTGNPFGRPIEDGTFLGLVISAGEDEPAELFTDIATISNATWDDTTLTLNGSNATAQLIGTPVSGTDYHYVFNYDVPDGTICYLRFGGGANQAFITGPASGTFNAVYPATGTDYLMQIATDTGGPSTFSNFSVKEYSETAGSANSNAFTMTVSAAAVTLPPVDISQSQVLDEALLSQQGSITAATVTQSQVLEQAALAQYYQEIQVADLSQAQAIEAAILIQEGGITARVISQSQTLEQAILAISGIVVNDISQGQAIEQALMLQTGTIAVHNLTQSQSIDAPNLLQTYVLPIVDISQGQVLGTADLQVDTTTLQPVSVQQAVVLETPGLTQYAVITADSITQGQVVATCNVGDLTAGTLDGKYVLYASMDAEFIIH